MEGRTKNLQPGGGWGVGEDVSMFGESIMAS